jgi:hypothetical protein
VLPVANAGAGRTFLGRPVGSAGRHECREFAGTGLPRYLVKADAQPRARDVEELIDVDVFPLRGSLDAASVEAESVEATETFLCWVPIVRGLIWLVTRRCKLSTDGCGSRGPSDFPETGADRGTLSLTFLGRMRLSIGERDPRALGGGTVHSVGT